MIKAIETVYNGYRFRSRLEARWAVFFDALGVKYEYEAEGFEIGNGLRHLPDFSIQNGVLIEIKPKDSFIPVMKRKYIYLAGKINANFNDWRHELAFEKDLSEKHHFTCFYKYENSNELEGNLPTFRGIYRYTGPFFDCNHGTYMDHIHKRSLCGINRADYIFAWINTSDCFGTISEIGYAGAMRNKNIRIGIHESLNIEDFRFVLKFAHFQGVYPNVKDAWDDLMRNPLEIATKEEKKLSRLSQNEIVFLMQGDPFDCQIYKYIEGGCESSSLSELLYTNGFTSLQIEQAALKSRQARFEHGENGR